MCEAELILAQQTRRDLVTIGINYQAVFGRRLAQSNQRQIYTLFGINVLLKQILVQRQHNRCPQPRTLYGVQPKQHPC